MRETGFAGRPAVLRQRAAPPDELTLYARCAVCGQRVHHSVHTDTLACACAPHPPLLQPGDRLYANATLQTRRDALLYQTNL